MRKKNTDIFKQILRGKLHIEEVKKKIYSKLYEFGIDSVLIGYKYIVEIISIKVILGNKRIKINSFYYYIDRFLKEKKSKVKKEMQYAIECGYRNKKQLYKNVLKINKKPSNKKFINKLSEILEKEIIAELG